ncbi:hypothetical protein NDU88_004779 [Pleurodeles waltl]|uniref:Reverse transcriptase domain-containing protein n=1 Tax=Pleurodeles waltl TaxID=8319 RepID=A0AAV7MHJ8_PLEWA|nr:hypothetical protein NDU88_004779 [Pleurodeles waltl]
MTAPVPDMPKSKLFADDIILNLKQEIDNVQRVFDRINEFTQIGGYKINENKTEVLLFNAGTENLPYVSQQKANSSEPVRSTADRLSPGTPTFNPDVRVPSKRKDGQKRAPLFEEEEDRRLEDEEQTTEGDLKEEPQGRQPTRETETNSGEDDELEAPRRGDALSTARTSRYNSSHIPEGTWLSQLTGPTLPS